MSSFWKVVIYKDYQLSCPIFKIGKNLNTNSSMTSYAGIRIGLFQIIEMVLWMQPSIQSCVFWANSINEVLGYNRGVIWVFSIKPWVIIAYIFIVIGSILSNPTKVFVLYIRLIALRDSPIIDECRKFLSRESYRFESGRCGRMHHDPFRFWNKNKTAYSGQ